jgi:hypothetical protein
MTSLRQIKVESWDFYLKWRKTGSYCPALKTTVRVSLKGWNHIIGQGVKKRNPDDVFRRLNLLPHAKSIIEESHTIQNRVVKNGRTFYILEAIVNDVERRKVVTKKVRVILIEDREKNKIFLSVMGKKI